ncbi:thymidine phosphorylase [Aestuariivirga sp. YIM B02566]|uniref:Thymidine phosphorylase n=1 Tax=Taklimakanibacter albus TaxID=2800327 RepID=A0ACC5REN3_9HYPH|nr:thymidine phosphorylase [Aestuariivirga sp. YIM B02566]MBK1871077.1 thymidine phosphorylase [Aestuariivirga sp. YIM B02566]
MLAQEFIRRKRDGKDLAPADIADFIQGLTTGSVSEGQAAAFAMAVFLRGMSRAEAVALTEAMRDSGTVLDWRDLGRPVVDKHSTGGVGDNVSLMLAPMLAALGCAVPMISGRGLGHTGGTLDKLDAIPGYVSQPDLALFRKVVREAGCAVIGQTADLAPADKRLYAIRDVTGTVESVPLITASILSKKLAAGLEQLVLDVKTGTGAFMATAEEARELTESLVSVANGAGLKTSALITDMNEPLASAAGNAVEIANALDYLTGVRRDPRLHEVTVALGAELLHLAGLARSDMEGRAMLEGTLSSGKAAEHFQIMAAGLGGPKDLIENYRAQLPKAPIIRPVSAAGEGVVAHIDTRSLGLAVIELGGGRRVASDKIDHAVGLTELAGRGVSVGRDRPLALIHARDEASFARAAEMVRGSYRLGEAPPVSSPVLTRIGA